MQHAKDPPVKLMKKLAENVCTAGQKDYALAQRHAAQFSSQFSETTSIMRESQRESHVNDFPDTQKNFNGAHHAKK